MLYYGIWIVGAISSIIIPIILLYRRSVTSVAYVQSLISERRRLIEGILTLVAGLATLGSVVSLFGLSENVARPAARSAVTAAPIVAPPDTLTEPKASPQVIINNFEGIAATLSLKMPTSGIDCSQVRRRSNGIWDIRGNIQVGGVTLADVHGVGPRGFNIGGNDLASLLDQKCGLSQSPSFGTVPGTPSAPGPN